MVQFISKATLFEEALDRRKRLIEESAHSHKGELLRELSHKTIPVLKFPAGFDLSKITREATNDEKRQGMLAEFIGNVNFGAEWYTRQRYEVYAGRDMEAELWRAIYVEIQDSNLPKVIPVHRIGPGGVVFKDIRPGGEVVFASVESSDFTVTLVDSAVGLQYGKELVKYNHLWTVSIVERQVGIAYNAKQNHIHFAPILNGSYSTSGTKPTETAASSDGANLLEKYMSTYEQAVQDAKKRNIRPPYVTLTGSLNSLKARKALLITIQDGNPEKSPVTNEISTIIEYDGWEGTMLGETEEYPGVADNVGYLIGLGAKMDDFQSYQNTGLMSTEGNPDVSRRIMAQTIWDFDRGVYCDTTAVQKINWPTS